MKSMSLILACTFLGAAALSAQDQQQQTTTTTRTTTTYGNGTLSEYVPGTSFVVKESSGPVTYRYGKKVTYETKNGTVISETDLPTRVKVGAPVRVYYDQDGDARVVSRVVVDED
jgi:hypothetical protein